MSGKWERVSLGNKAADGNHVLKEKRSMKQRSKTFRNSTQTAECSFPLNRQNRKGSRPHGRDNCGGET